MILTGLSVKSLIKSRLALFASSAVIVAINIAMRSPLVLLSPGLYQEEILYTSDSLKYGLLSLFNNHNQYLDVAGRLLNLSASYLSFENIALLLVVFYAVLNSYYIYLLASSGLAGKKYSWVMMFLFLFFPSEPEWTGISLYTFWITTLILFWRETEINLMQKKGSISCLIAEIIFILSGPLAMTLAPMYALRIFKRKFTTESFIKLLACLLQLLCIISNRTGSSLIKIQNILLDIPGLLSGLIEKLVSPFTFLPLNSQMYVFFYIISTLFLLNCISSKWSEISRDSKARLANIAYLFSASLALSLMGPLTVFYVNAVAAPRYILVPVMLGSHLLLVVIDIALTGQVHFKKRYVFSAMIASCLSVYITKGMTLDYNRTSDINNIPISFASAVKRAYIQGSGLQYKARNTPDERFWTFSLSHERIEAACMRSFLKCSF